MRYRSSIFWKAILTGWLFILLFVPGSFGQAPAAAAVSKPVVKRINEIALKELLKPKGKPLLINFWATWCDPCRDEFPDLVKLDNEYKDRIDFITISLDFPEDIETTVPKFLADMKAEMPTYVLITPDETSAIGSVNKDWQGGLPFTILFDKEGKTAFLTQRVVKPEEIRPEIDKLLPPAKPQTGDVVEARILSLHVTVYTFEQGIEAAKADIEKNEFKVIRYGLTPAIPAIVLTELKRKYGLLVEDTGCLVMNGYDQFALGYNETMIAALTARHGPKFAEKVAFAPVRR